MCHGEGSCGHIKLPKLPAWVLKWGRAAQLTLRDAVDLCGCGAGNSSVWAWLAAPLAAELPRLEALLLLGAYSCEAACALPSHDDALVAGGRLWHASSCKDTLCAPCHRVICSVHAKEAVVGCPYV